MNRMLLIAPLLLALSVALADDASEATRADAKPNTQADDGPKALSGMSILGNREAPKSLVIVPWKSSRIGDAVGIATMLDDSREPVDREVFMRELRYFEIQHAGGDEAAGAGETTGRE